MKTFRQSGSSNKLHLTPVVVVVGQRMIGVRSEASQQQPVGKKAHYSE